MKLSLNWIRDYVAIPEDFDLKQLAFDLTMSTVEVEGVEELARRFDGIGVLPQILSLGCGVTIASYGRPTMRFAATDDPSCKIWAPSQRFPLSIVEGTASTWSSCYYTELFPLTDNTALFVYSDFFYPNEYGAPAKAVLVRTITVIQE